MVARLYRFRWQIELCIKEWKSYANLHQFDTANAHIAAGLIWTSLCAAALKPARRSPAPTRLPPRQRPAIQSGSRPPHATPAGRITPETRLSDHL